MAFVPISLTEVRKRVALILNAGPDDGSYATVSTDQQKYADGEVTDAILEADLEVCRTIVNTLGNGYRPNYVSAKTYVTQGVLIDFHPGKMGAEVIVTRSNTTNAPGILAPSLESIAKWLDDSVLFPLATCDGRYYISEESRVYFMGTSITISLPNDLVNTGACQAPINYTATVIRGAVSLLGKDGVDMNLIQSYYAQFQRDLEVIKAGESAVPALDLFKRTVG